MSPARTTGRDRRMGGARARGARALEMRLADTIGGWVGACADPAAQGSARASRHATTRSTPSSGTVSSRCSTTSSSPTIPPTMPTWPRWSRRWATRDDVAAGLARRVRATPSPRSSPSTGSGPRARASSPTGPMMRVLDLVLRDEEFDLHEGRGDAPGTGVLTSAEGNSRALDGTGIVHTSNGGMAVVGAPRPSRSPGCALTGF